MCMAGRMQTISLETSISFTIRSRWYEDSCEQVLFSLAESVSKRGSAKYLVLSRLPYLQSFVFLDGLVAFENKAFSRRVSAQCLSADRGLLFSLCHSRSARESGTLNTQSSVPVSKSRTKCTNKCRSMSQIRFCGAVQTVWRAWTGSLAPSLNNKWLLVPALQNKEKTTYWGTAMTREVSPTLEYICQIVSRLCGNWEACTWRQELSGFRCIYGYLVYLYAFVLQSSLLQYCAWYSTADMLEVQGCQSDEQQITVCVSIVGKWPDMQLLMQSMQ